HYWHVRAKDAAGNYSDWSVTWSVTIKKGMDITFFNGWNLVSFYYLPENRTIEAVFSEIDESIDYVYKWDSTGNHYMYYHRGYGGQFTEIDKSHGFWVHSTNAKLQQLLITEMIEPSEQIYLTEGWNLVGWQSQETVSIETGLNNILGYVDYVYRWNSNTQSYEYYHVGYGGQFDSFEPEYGYWLHCSEECVWICSSFIGIKEIGVSDLEANFNVTLVKIGYYTHLQYGTSGPLVTHFRTDLIIENTFDGENTIYPNINCYIVDDEGTKWPVYFIGSPADLSGDYGAFEIREGYLVFENINEDSEVLIFTIEIPTESLPVKIEIPFEYP
ncbi:MAG TPA: hypothetical protein PK718_04785, partial [Candidatus Methanofastidiosa archaeon]|nr:hypothetical protein [Candidatus Methanofastidiosa archaeon]